MPAGQTTAHPADAGSPRRVYWAQARILEAVATAGTDAAIAGDAGRLAAHLRARDAVIVCGPDTVEIEEPATDDPSPTPTVEDPADGQLVLPIPFFSFNPRRPRPGRPIVRSRTQNPHRDPPERE